MEANLQGSFNRGRRRGQYRRWDSCPGASRCGWRKRGIQTNELGRSRGGFSTKVHAIVDTQGRPLHVELTPGQRHDSVVAPNLLKHARGRFLIADAGYDSNEFRRKIRKHKMTPVIASHPNRKRKLPKNRDAYRKRFRVEVFFHDLKRYRALATRYEKTASSFLGLVHLCCALSWL